MDVGGAPLRRALWGLLGATLIVVSILALRAGARSGPLSSGDALPVLATLPEFELRNRDGRLVTSAELRGQLWIASFIFTRCRGACPRITQRLIGLGDEALALPRRVSISVDPEYDQPEVLAEYARSQGVRDERWLFVTGDRAAVYSLVREGFKLAVEAQGSMNPDEPIIHSTRLVLVDGQGRVRGTYDAFDDEALAALERDIARLAR